MSIPREIAGTPTNGTSGTFAGYAEPGETLLDTVGAAQYINTGSKASPTWTLVQVGTNGSFSGTLAVTGATTLSSTLAVTGNTTLTGNASIAAGSNKSIGFYGATPGTKPTITGSRGSNAALADLLTKLATLGLITDSTS